MKNLCLICREQVKNKDGIQCKGACRKWAHFKCLGFCPSRIKDIKQGIEEVTCICPGCKATKQNVAQGCPKSAARPAMKCPTDLKEFSKPLGSPCKKKQEQSKCNANDQRPPQRPPNANSCNKGQQSQPSPKVSKDSACVGGCVADTSRFSFCSDSCPNLAKKCSNTSEQKQCPSPSPPQTRSLSDTNTKCGQPAENSLQISNEKFKKIKCTLDKLVTCANTLSVEVQLLLCQIKELEWKETKQIL